MDLMNKITILGVIGLTDTSLWHLNPESGLMASATYNNENNGNNGNHHNDNSSYDSPKVKVYKVVINNGGNPVPIMSDFGVKLKDTLVTINGTTFTIPKNKPVSLTEMGAPGYSRRD